MLNGCYMSTYKPLVGRSIYVGAVEVGNSIMVSVGRACGCGQVEGPIGCLLRHGRFKAGCRGALCWEKNETTEPWSGVFSHHKKCACKSWTMSLKFNTSVITIILELLITINLHVQTPALLDRQPTLTWRLMLSKSRTNAEFLVFESDSISL